MTDTPTGHTRAVAALERTATLIRQRAGTHGDAVAQHQSLAQLWSTYLGVQISAADAALMLLLLKTSRIAQNRAHIAAEHTEDVIGYAAIAEACRQVQTEEQEPTA